MGIQVTTHTCFGWGVDADDLMAWIASKSEGPCGGKVKDWPCKHQECWKVDIAPLYLLVTRQHLDGEETYSLTFFGEDEVANLQSIKALSPATLEAGKRLYADISGDDETDPDIFSEVNVS